jgi:hypothetical protein
MDLKKRLSALDQIYSIYDEFAATMDLACQKSCAHCCTTHVTLTTLEGYYLVGHLPLESKAELREKIRTKRDTGRFRPQMTTNQLADLCAKGIDPPDVSPRATEKTCPLLNDLLCSLYEFRPFGCRCLVSKYNCTEKGYAEIDDFVLSVNTVIVQTIEHLDGTGCTGNLTDLLEVMLNSENWSTYEKGALSCPENGLVRNHALTVLMIPPEHRARMQPILKSLRQIKF